MKKISTYNYKGITITQTNLITKVILNSTKNSSSKIVITLLPKNKSHW